MQRREILRYGAASLGSIGLVSQFSGNAAADEPNIDNYATVEIKEHWGVSVDYEIQFSNAWVEPDEETTESEDHEIGGFGPPRVEGTVNDGFDKFYLSGGVVTEITVDDRGPDSHSYVTVDITQHSGHCDDMTGTYSEIGISNVDDGSSDYKFTMSGSTTEADDSLEGDDSSFDNSGTVYGGSDGFDAYGNLIWMQLEPQNNKMIFTRTPDGPICNT